jgi:hypothetical protein
MIPTTSAPPPATVAELIEARAQLQSWIARLEELAPEVPAHVARRVLADYEARLDAVVQALADHAEELRRERERLRTDLDDALQRHEESVDALDEGRLRFRVGEVPEEEWEARRPEMEADAEAAAAEAQQLRGALERHQELLDQVDGSAPAERIHLPEVVVADIASLAPDEDGEEGEEDGGEARDEYEPPSDEDTLPEPIAELAFLQVLDRALAEESQDGPVHVLTESELEKRPKPGVKCPDCGYTNDASAWYCGVCGVDLS